MEVTGRNTVSAIDPSSLKQSRVLLLLKIWQYGVTRFCSMLSVVLTVLFIPALVRWWTRRKVTILYYHDPRPEVFERHLVYMSKRYNFITIHELVEAFSNKDWSQFPCNPLLITIDDGYKGNFYLLEICKNNGVRPLIYLCSEVIGTSRGFWPHHVPSGVRELLKSFESQVRTKVLKDKYKFDFEEEQRSREALSRDEIRIMRDYFDFGSHTKFHEILTTCEDSHCEDEIVQSKEDLETKLEVDCRHFSFPNGDHDLREREFVKRAGYLTARTIDIGWNNSDTDPFRLKAIGVGDDAPTYSLGGRLTGIPLYLKRLLAGENFYGRHKTVKINKFC
jgi:peptidoglycan/xylan/chitin deacetylase (PgdA/CDA1 family)